MALVAIPNGDAVSPISPLIPAIPDAAIEPQAQAALPVTVSSSPLELAAQNLRQSYERAQAVLSEEFGPIEQRLQQVEEQFSSKMAQYQELAREIPEKRAALIRQFEAEYGELSENCRELDDRLNRALPETLSQERASLTQQMSQHIQKQNDLATRKEQTRVQLSGMQNEIQQQHQTILSEITDLRERIQNYQRLLQVDERKESKPATDDELVQVVAKALAATIANLNSAQIREDLKDWIETESSLNEQLAIVEDRLQKTGESLDNLDTEYLPAEDEIREAIGSLGEQMRGLEDEGIRIQQELFVQLNQTLEQLEARKAQHEEQLAEFDSFSIELEFDIGNLQAHHDLDLMEITDAREEIEERLAALTLRFKTDLANLSKQDEKAPASPRSLSGRVKPKPVELTEDFYQQIEGAAAIPGLLARRRFFLNLMQQARISADDLQDLYKFAEVSSADFYANLGQFSQKIRQFFEKM